eukprot:5970612-Prymnesium_polylepis.1
MVTHNAHEPPTQRSPHARTAHTQCPPHARSMPPQDHREGVRSAQLHRARGGGGGGWEYHIRRRDRTSLMPSETSDEMIEMRPAGG